MNPIFENLRSNLGSSVLSKHRPATGFKTKRVAKRIPLELSGGVGDVIMALPLVQKIKYTCGPVEIWTKHPDVYGMFFDDPCFHGNDFKGYDYWMVINSIVKFKFGDNFSGFRNDEVLKLYLNYRTMLWDWKREVEYHPYLDNQMAIKAVKKGFNRRTLPWHFLGLEYKKLPPTDPSQPPKMKYITIHQGFETNQKHIVGRSTKNWTRSKWELFVREFKKKHPDIKVVQLGAVTGQDIGGVDHNFRNKLSLKESFLFLSHSLCHVDGDSGLVHAANVFEVPSVVMFGSTPADFFGYENNTNITSNGCIEGGGCWWLREDWLKRCVLGVGSVPCMDGIKVEQVLKSVTELLKRGKVDPELTKISASYFPEED